VDGPSFTKGMSQMLKILGVNVDVSMFDQNVLAPLVEAGHKSDEILEKSS
jgi:hypothetical protein